MKKIAVLALFTVALLGGCGGSKDDKAADSSSSAVESSTTVASSTTESTVATEADKFAGQAEVGNGSMVLYGAGGSTEDGSALTVFYDPNTIPTSFDVSTTDIDGSMLSYIYVDGQLIAKEQLGTSQHPVEIQDTPSAIKEGTHTVQLVQYSTDDEAGDIVTFKTQQYELKLK
ncbi:hypothetical protein P7G87_00245 [Enterococcus asini]|uniref:hypothetical protein n=1 Tax=Enterococcus asini TaxID=57732 RepID=UPI002890E3EF|nr:hypothetical protein [Enterococcus asini]MDT2783116.1 hypothetical protein [Enterococcus asini]